MKYDVPTMTRDEAMKVVREALQIAAGQLSFLSGYIYSPANRDYSDAALEAAEKCEAALPFLQDAAGAVGDDLFKFENGKDADIVDRLRGLVRVPIKDGLGPVEGQEDYFERVFPSCNAAKEAADYIEKLRRALKPVENSDPGEADLLAEDGVIYAWEDFEGSEHGVWNAFKPEIKLPGLAKYVRTVENSGGVGVPDGWKLVPIHPTDDMINSVLELSAVRYGPKYYAYGPLEWHYTALIEASPPPPATQLDPRDEQLRLADEMALVAGKQLIHPGEMAGHIAGLRVKVMAYQASRQQGNGGGKA